MCCAFVLVSWDEASSARVKTEKDRCEEEKRGGKVLRLCREGKARVMDGKREG